MPPCPGNMLPESFTSPTLLKKLSVISPITAKVLVEIPIIIASTKLIYGIRRYPPIGTKHNKDIQHNIYAPISP